jgi:phosphate transport system substrate-binding protein
MLSGTLPALVALLAAACGDAGGSGGSADSDFDYDSLSGQVRIDGSSTVYPITEAVAEEFAAVTDAVATVAFSGTGGGFEKFCRGEIEVSDASRPIKDSEVDACKSNNIEDIVEIQVAIDALTVMVHPDNDFAQCMTVDQLYAVFAQDGGADRWSDIDPSWPNDRIVKFYPGEDSGTYDYFVEAIIEGADVATDDSLHTDDGTPSENDRILAQGIENDKNAIGYFGFAYFLEAGDQLKAVEVDGDDGCVEPSFEAALDGSYTPLSRPLFIYTTEKLLSERREVLGFVNFYLENMQDLVPEVGYVKLPDDLYDEQLAKVDPFLQ